MHLPEAYRGFVISGSNFEPAYLHSYNNGTLSTKAEEALKMLERCAVCPRRCEVNRLKDEVGFCKTGRFAIVSSYFAHFGEEDCLRGWRGSGTIFFCQCNLKCAFCQNYDISHFSSGRVVTAKQLANMMLELQEQGCHNINFVTPSHVVPQILEALLIAVEGGLRLPLVYNTGGYDSIETLQLLEGVIDIYMPDFKFWTSQRAKRYLRCEDYPEIARAAFKEMHRQVGDLRFDENGIALKGLLVRHLVMPGCIDETRQIMRFLAEEISRDTFVNIMAQYYPAGSVNNRSYPEINRRITKQEYEEAVEAAREAGLYRFDERWRSIISLRWL
ncbi:MAG: radical SAM protein [Armatimonadota bacterium]|nr:radical SAM protein [Armatimonadota bacterium]MCX7776872.1 radical SAM protein [Armatimonadota bacterium]MDW8024442.1 radical SAM protein [Armatimonadota bacterium]